MDALRRRLALEWPLVRLRYTALLQPHRIFLALLTAVGFYLRLRFALQLDYFQDEIDLQQTALFGDLSPQGLALPGIVHGLFMALAHSTSGLTLRLPSILFGAACIPAVYALGRDVYGRAAGLYAAIFLAISPLAIFSAAEGRPYGMFQFFVILSLIGFFGMERGTMRDGLFYAAAVCLCTLTHLLTAQVLLGLGISTVVWFALDRNPSRLIRIGLFTALAMVIPVLTMIGRPLASDSGIGHFTRPFWYLIERSLSALTYTFYPTRAATFISDKGGWLFGALALVPLFERHAKNRHVAITLWIVFFTSMVVTFQTLGMKMSWEWWPRYIYHCQPLLLVLMAGGIDALQQRNPASPRWLPIASVLLLFWFLTPPQAVKQMPSPLDEGGRMVRMARAIRRERAHLRGVIIPDTCVFIPVRRLVAIYAAVRDDALPAYATVRARSQPLQHEAPFVPGGLHVIENPEARYGLGPHGHIAEGTVDRFPPGTYPLVQLRGRRQMGCEAIARITGGNNTAVLNAGLSARTGMIVCDISAAEAGRALRRDSALR